MASSGDCEGQCFAKCLPPSRYAFYHTAHPAWNLLCPHRSSSSSHRPGKGLLPPRGRCPTRGAAALTPSRPPTFSPQKASHVPLLWLPSLFPQQPVGSSLPPTFTVCAPLSHRPLSRAGLGSPPASLWHPAQRLPRSSPAGPLSLGGDTNATASFMGA